MKNEKMFYNFLKKYIKNYFDENEKGEKYNFDDETIEELAKNVDDNEYLWETIDEIIKDEINWYLEK